ncbi:hypothetical protein [Desulfoscipio gibsoniae]|uniref:hypothetical protein n=1 Tax=Desulfoscipio gibsoniae TaxID=102134 RepID=UPI0002E1E599|nr:hypothetical protein [Desulfoscipio gibsoniae]
MKNMLILWKNIPFANNHSDGFIFIDYHRRFFCSKPFKLAVLSCRTAGFFAGMQ